MVGKKRGVIREGMGANRTPASSTGPNGVLKERQAGGDDEWHGRLEQSELRANMSCYMVTWL